MQGLINRRRRRVAAPQVGAVDLGRDRFEHGRQLGGRQLIKVAAHQRQAEPQFVVAAQGGHGATDLGRLEPLITGQGTEMAQHVDQGQEGVPVPVGPEVQQPLALLDLESQLLHPATVLLELAAVAPPVGGMEFELLLQLLHQLGLALHLGGQVVLGGVHVVATGHRSDRQGQAAAGLIAVAQLTGVAQLGGLELPDLQTAQLGVQADHRRTGQQNPEVVVGQAQQQRELARAVDLLHNHGRCDPALELGCLDAHQRALTGELQCQRQLVGQGLLGLMLQNPLQAPFLAQATALLFIVLKVFPGHIARAVLELLKPFAQLGDRRLVIGQIQGGQIPPEAALDQLLGLGQVVALQQVQHHAVAGGELADQRVSRSRGQLARLAHPLKAALHRDHIALGVEPAAAGPARHLQKLAAHERTVTPLGAL